MAKTKHSWEPGTSGNPRGRPTSARAKMIPIAQHRERLNKDANKVIDKVLELAKQGSEKPLEIVLNRLLPAYKPVDPPMKVPGLEDPGKAPDEQVQAMLQAVGRGELAAPEAAKMISGLASILDSAVKLRSLDAFGRSSVEAGSLDEWLEQIQGTSLGVPKRLGFKIQERSDVIEGKLVKQGD